MASRIRPAVSGNQDVDRCLRELTTGLASAATSEGPQGIPGTNGTNGTNGANGSNGATGATGPAGPSGGGGWVILYEEDFPTETTQNFLPGGDGHKTMSSGTVITAFGTANCAASGVINGTGAQCTINVATGGIQAGFALNSTIVPEMATFPGGEEWEYTAAFSVSTQSQNNEQAALTVGEAGVADRSTVGFRWNAGASNIFFQYSEPPGAGTQVKASSVTTNLSDTVFQTRIKNASYLEAWSGPFTGGMGGTWPNTMRLRGTRTHTAQTAQWIAGAQSVTISLIGDLGASMNARTLTLKYARIRRRTVV